MRLRTVALLCKIGFLGLEQVRLISTWTAAGHNLVCTRNRFGGRGGLFGRTQKGTETPERVAGEGA